MNSAMNDWRKSFDYDQKRGELRWGIKSPNDFDTDLGFAQYTGRYMGRPAGCKTNGKKGEPKCVLVWAGGRLVRAHRIIWEMHNGPIPTDLVVDHINGDPWDNRLENLRLATRSQNQMNHAVCSRNRSGVSGVHLDGATGKWRASIKANGVAKKLGRFDSLDDAIAARRNAEALMFGLFTRK